jgi:hypothetical protein
MLTDLFARGKIYYLRAAVANPTAEQLRMAPATDRDAVQRTYSARGRDVIDVRVTTLARRLAARELTDYDAVQAFIREIQRRCVYNLRAEKIDGDVDRVEAFLFSTNEGYCDLFASALAAMCRSIGIRSRVAIGYLMPEPIDATYIVRERHAHMWTEVYFDGYGWVTFDATDGATALPGAGVGSVYEEESEAVGSRWPMWAGLSVFGAIFLALLAGSYLSWRRSIVLVPPELKKLRPLYAQYLRLIRRVVGRPKATGETTSEYAAAYEVGTGSDTAAELARLFDLALYAQDSPQESQVAQIRSRLTELKGLRANGR